MQSQNLQTLKDQIKKKQASLKMLDDKIGEQLTKKALLQDLYYDDINASSLSSSSLVQYGHSQEQSKLSGVNDSASIDSSFLQEEITRVRDYLQKTNANVTIGETTMFTKQDKNMKKTLQFEKNQHQKYAKKDYSYFSKPVRQQISQNDQFYEAKRIQNQQKMKFMKDFQQTKRKEIGKYLNERQIDRQREIQKERQMLRTQLIRQNEEKQKKQMEEKQTTKRKRVDTFIYEEKNLSIYQVQRNRALSSLLKQTRRETRRTEKILEKTRNLIFS